MIPTGGPPRACPRRADQVGPAGDVLPCTSWRLAQGQGDPEALRGEQAAAALVGDDGDASLPAQAESFGAETPSVEPTIRKLLAMDGAGSARLRAGPLPA